MHVTHVPMLTAQCYVASSEQWQKMTARSCGRAMLCLFTTGTVSELLIVPLIYCHVKVTLDKALTLCSHSRPAPSACPSLQQFLTHLW